VDCPTWEQLQDSTLVKTWQLEVKLSGATVAIFQSIQVGTALAVSNGTYKEGMGAAAWTIKGSLAEQSSLVHA